jgi:hypothetical protein
VLALKPFEGDIDQVYESAVPVVTDEKVICEPVQSNAGDEKLAVGAVCDLAKKPSASTNMNFNICLIK